MHEPELHLRRPDGEWRVLCASTAPIGRDGRVQGAVVVYQDVTAKTPKMETGQGTGASLRGMPRREGCVLLTEDGSERRARACSHAPFRQQCGDTGRNVTGP